GPRHPRGCPAAHERRLLPGGGGRPDRPGGPQWCREDDTEQGALRHSARQRGQRRGARSARLPAAGHTRRGQLRDGALRIPAARGLDDVLRRLRRAEEEMADMSLSEARREKAMNRYPRLEAELDSRGGYAAEAEAKRMSANLGLPNRLLEQDLGTLSGGQRRRV